MLFSIILDICIVDAIVIPVFPVISNLKSYGLSFKDFFTSITISLRVM